MGKTAKQATMVVDEHGTQHRFAAGDVVPDDLVELIDNPAVWETVEPEAYEPMDPTQLTPTASILGGHEVQAGVFDAPYAQPSDERPVGVVNQAMTGLEGETPESLESDGPDGGSSEPPAPAGVKPSSADLDGMTLAELEEVAANLNISVPSKSTKAQVRGWIDSAPDVPLAEG